MLLSRFWYNGKGLDKKDKNQEWLNNNNNDINNNDNNNDNNDINNNNDHN